MIAPGFDFQQPIPSRRNCQPEKTSGIMVLGGGGKKFSSWPGRLPIAESPWAKPMAGGENI